MSDLFSPSRNAPFFSVKDLLEARDTHHYFLSHLENVVGTAVGRFLLRRDDPDARGRERYRSRLAAPPRTFQNSVVRPWSWPSVLVLVNRWLKETELRRRNPYQVVPPWLHLPDGRMVPTCVVYVEPNPGNPDPMAQLNFPSDLIGGGYPVITDVQGEEHFGSVGCLVSDGNQTYALTNRHVAGPPGQQVFSLIRAERKKVGVSDERQLGKKPFEEVYPGWPGMRATSNLDVGLIRVDEVGGWTAQVFGIGELGDLVNVDSSNLNLGMIGWPVRAFGAATGPMSGSVYGLFYRYKSVAGTDYVADLLIGPDPENGQLETRRGDSGTLWVLDPGGEPERPQETPDGGGGQARQLRPLALQWGGQQFGGVVGHDLRFVLATFLSTICRELDLDVVREWNRGLPEYWGKTAHYKIGAKACDLLPQGKLRTLMQRNLDRIAFTDPSILGGDLKKIDAKQFVPLADVPDYVWRKTRRKDNSSHFADMDEPGKGDFANRTLLTLCKNKDNVSSRIWNNFYESLDVGLAHRGKLPFRVWQIYDEMVSAARAKSVSRFVCAAGILAHFIGDACQPLHVSHLHHGRPGHSGENRVHSVYEEDMIARRVIEVIEGSTNVCKTRRSKPR